MCQNSFIVVDIIDAIVTAGRCLRYLFYVVNDLEHLDFCFLQVNFSIFYVSSILVCHVVFKLVEH